MPLGEASVVQCSKTAHTLLQHLGTIMDRLPTLLIVVDSADSEKDCLPRSPNDQALQLYDQLNTALLRGIKTGLPLALVASKEAAKRAKQILPGNAIAELPDEIRFCINSGDALPKAIALGVANWPNAHGWIILPTSTSTLEAETLTAIAKAMVSQSIVYTQHNQQPAPPIGFGSEFFSELIRIQSRRELDRLINRYPSICLGTSELASNNRQHSSPLTGYEEAPIKGAS